MAGCPSFLQLRHFRQSKTSTCTILTRVRNTKYFFLFLNQNICCWYSKEPSKWDGSFEHPKHVLKIMGNKIFTILRWNFFVYLNLCFSSGSWFDSRSFSFTGQEPPDSVRSTSSQTPRVSQEGIRVAIVLTFIIRYLHLYCTLKPV